MLPCLGESCAITEAGDRHHNVRAFTNMSSVVLPNKTMTTADRIMEINVREIWNQFSCVSHGAAFLCSILPLG